MADERKGTGNWKPLPKDPGPGTLQGTVPPIQPIHPDDPFGIERQKAEVPAVSKTNPVPTEVGGGSNVKKKK
ncbi:MAG: hypothetical protein KAJ55_16255 [Anaerolineales bacterium]|nr:hypothetical protein [Anaerolineales bacterium]